MKDTIDRPAAVRVARERSGVEGSCCRNGDARRSDPYGDERDRIAYVAFAASLNRTDEGKAAQENGREVT